MSALRVAVIGAGHLGKIHTRILSTLEGVQLAGIADLDLENARKVAADYRTEAFRDYRELLGKIDAAVIAVPTRGHHAVGMDLLNHNVHLLIEKPLALNVREAEALHTAAARRGLVLAVGHVERFNPAWRALAPQIQQPKYLEARRLSTYTFRSTDIGVVLDLMIHDLDLVLELIPEPVTRVEALGISIFGKQEDIVQARLTFAGGCIANLTASRASYHAVRTMQVWSPRKFVNFDFAARAATCVEPSHELLQRQFDEAKLTPQEREELKSRLFEDLLRRTSVTPEPCDQITAELVDFTTAIRERRLPRVDARQARDTIALAERILQAVEQHAWNGTPHGPHGALLMPAAATAAPFAVPVPVTMPVPVPAVVPVPPVVTTTHPFLAGPHWGQAARKAQAPSQSDAEQQD